MKRLKRLTVVIIVLVLVFTMIPVSAQAAGWNDYGDRYQLDDGSWAIGFWMIDDTPFFFLDDGQLVNEEGWYVETLDGEDYYFYVFRNGVCAEDTWITDDYGDTYYFDGVFYVIGHWEINGVNYFFDSNGVLVSQEGWHYETIDGEDYWFYVLSNGKCATGHWKINGTYYYFDSDGALVNTEGWYKEELSNGETWWAYVYSNGVCATSTWKIINGSRYYFNEYGWSVDSCIWKINNKYYSFNKNGVMETGWIRAYMNYGDSPEGSHWCWLYGNPDGGALFTGWNKINNEWYYFYPSGSRACELLTNGWAKDGTGWMWMDSSGKITKNKWIKDGSEWYYLKSNGYMAANEWAKDSTGWMWMDSSGKITKNKWIQYKGEWYYLKSNGYMAASEWAKDSTGWMWMDSSGKITKNKWIQYKGDWYYLKSNGYMAANEYAKDSSHTYWMDSNGRIARVIS